MIRTPSQKEIRLKLSIVMPVWNEEAILPELKRRIDSVLSLLPEMDGEIIFANDGSRDGTPRILAEMAEQDSRVVVVNLSRNFGHQPCLMAGLGEATGDVAILLDGDLEDPPELMPELLAKWKDGYGVVIAVRKSRQASFLRRVVFAGFHRVLQVLTDFPILPNAGTYCALDRQAYRTLVELPESHRFLPGLRSWVGFRVGTVEYDRQARFAGEPRQSLRRLIRYAFDAVFGFSYKPLRLSLYSGAFTWLLSSMYAVVLVIQRLVGFNVVKGFTTTAVLVLFFGGFTLISLGILGEYLGRVYDEVKRRPLFVVERTIRAGRSL